LYDESDLIELSEDYLSRAHRISNPELRVIYLSIASGYQKLARFHEQIQPLVRTANRAQRD
jgi:hypothetical protein